MAASAGVAAYSARSRRVADAAELIVKGRLTWTVGTDTARGCLGSGPEFVGKDHDGTSAFGVAGRAHQLQESFQKITPETTLPEALVPALAGTSESISAARRSGN
jgi:hypothetical protein